MALTSEQKDRVRRLAEAEGYDIADALQLASLIAKGEGGNDGDDDESGDVKKNATSGEPPKLFQYQLPFLRVGEVRAYLKMIGAPLGDEPMPEENLPSGIWLAKYGGAPATAEPSNPAAPDGTA